MQLSNAVVEGGARPAFQPDQMCVRDCSHPPARDKLRRLKGGAVERASRIDPEEPVLGSHHSRARSFPQLDRVGAAQAGPGQQPCPKTGPEAESPPRKRSAQRVCRAIKLDFECAGRNGHVDVDERVLVKAGDCGTRRDDRYRTSVFGHGRRGRQQDSQGGENDPVAMHGRRLYEGADAGLSAS